MAGNKNSGPRPNQDSPYLINRFGKKCISWLEKNFHKCSFDKKVYIALEMAKRFVPQKLEGDGLGGNIVINVITNTAKTPGQHPDGTLFGVRAPVAKCSSNGAQPV